MKAVWLFSLVMCCASWTLGSGFAPPAQSIPTESSTSPEDANRQKNRNSSHGPKDQNAVSKRNAVRSPAPTLKIHYHQLPNNRQPFQQGRTANLHPSGSNKSDAVTEGGLFQHKTGSRVMPLRSANVIRHTTPSYGNVRHRGSNPAVVGGSTMARYRNSAAINGTTVRRRP